MSQIVIMGSGVVGTATGKGFAKAGHDVMFVDIDLQRVQDLRSEGYEASETLELGSEPSVIFLTLPTPDNGREWVLAPILSGAETVAEAIRDSDGFHTVVMRSTVPPGTTEAKIQPLIEKVSGKVEGLGFAIGSNPEFLRAKSAYEDFINPWMTIVGARSPRTRERLIDLLQPFGGEMRAYDDPAQAEMIKAAHNLYNAAKISFWNEMWQMCQVLDLDARAVAETVARSAEGSFNPNYGIVGGLPYGGACLPKDTKGFLGFAREVGVDMKMLRATDAVNETMKAIVGQGATDRVIDVTDVEIADNGRHQLSSSR